LTADEMRIGRVPGDDDRLGARGARGSYLVAFDGERLNKP